MTALLGGFVHVFSGEVSEVEGQVAAGTLRVLTVMSPERVGRRSLGRPDRDGVWTGRHLGHLARLLRTGRNQ